MSGGGGAVSRVAGNTGFLFLRTVLSVATGCLVVRIVLNALGVTDYGVYVAVMGVVSVFGTFNGVLQDTASRFICHAMAGDGGPRAVRDAFSSMLVLAFAFAALIVLVGETAGRAFLEHRLVLPEESRPAARFVFQCGVAAMALHAVQLPFVARIIAGERMRFFLGAGIAGAGLSLAGAWAVASVPRLALETCAAAETVSGAAVFAVHVLYCRRRFADVGLDLGFPRAILRREGAFMSLGFLSSVGNVLKYQCVCILVNLYAGVEFNASWKVALHVWSFLCPLSADFNQAFSPVVFKAWAGRTGGMGRLIGVTTAVSFALTAVPVLTVIAFAPQILSSWLGASVPPDAVLFVRCLLPGLVFDAISQPLTTSILATGRVALYQAVACLISASGFAASWALLASGHPAWMTAGAVAAVNGLGCAYRFAHVRAFVCSSSRPASKGISGFRV